MRFMLICYLCVIAVALLFGTVAAHDDTQSDLDRFKRELHRAFEWQQDIRLAAVRFDRQRQSYPDAFMILLLESFQTGCGCSDHMLVKEYYQEEVFNLLRDVLIGWKHQNPRDPHPLFTCHKPDDVSMKRFAWLMAEMLQIAKYDMSCSQRGVLYRIVGDTMTQDNQKVFDLMLALSVDLELVEAERELIVLFLKDMQRKTQPSSQAERHEVTTLGS